ncbi:pyridoxamine 5'-phosphate oxidase [Hahella ganghwensis]|uniref:pyridoxamine 5'-phosphate oxidase n=1 Tax=Hahella ganghwensis TaxID=286420 RepID=UPI0003699D1B|nr:pyridoxamine 5'-phosphate oxidase [Hahella ganghwensis]
MNLEDIRREYLQGGLDMADLDENPFRQFKSWLDIAIEAKLSADPTAMTVATVNAAGIPTQRVVLLKQADEQGFVFYTNLGSRKARDIEENANISLHFAWLPLERQIAITGTASKLSVTEATRYFLSRPHDSQLAAWASKQSNKVNSRQMLEQAFEQMKNRFRKGEVPLPSFWGGFRVVPSRFEFWQGRANRLHDRFEYLPAGDGWEINRLQP